MDDFFEVIIEALFEGLIDGIDTASTSRRLPAGVRILFAVLLFLFFGTVIGLIIFTGVMLITEDGIVWAGILMFAIAALMIGYLIWKFRKIFNRLG